MSTPYTSGEAKVLARKSGIPGYLDQLQLPAEPDTRLSKSGKCYLPCQIDTNLSSYQDIDPGAKSYI